MVSVSSGTQTIMDEVGVYRFNRDHVGMRREVWYDVTEYECWETSHSRRDRSVGEVEVLERERNGWGGVGLARRFQHFRV